MLLAYDLPRDWTYGITDGEWLTPDVELLHDFEPAERVRLAFNDSGSQTTATTTAVTATRVGAFVPRVGCILGLRGVPAGLKLELRGRRPADGGFTYELGGNALTQRTVEFPDGTVGAWWVLDAGLDAIIGYELQVYNDVAGGTVLEAEAELEIGQIVVAPALDVPIELGWSYSYRSGSAARRTLGAQVQRVARTPFRVTRLKPSVGSAAAAHGGGLPGGEDWQRLLARLSRVPFSAVVPRIIDNDEVQRQAAFGFVSVDAANQHVAGPLWRMQEMTFEEVPAG